jgi:transposase InsO family protein
MDWHSRYVLSWRISNSLETTFCLDEIDDALRQEQPEIINSGQGAQVTSVAFTESDNQISNVMRLGRLYGVFSSAKEQFEKGYLFNVRQLVHAEVFDNELDQASYFLGEDHKVPAAVIAGTVLETTLRALCENHPEINLPEKPKASKMNEELRTKEVYN